MSQNSSYDVRSFCDKVISSLPQFYDVDQAFFVDGKVAEPDEEFDCTIRMVTNIYYHLHIPLHPATKDFTFLECLLLNQTIEAKEIEIHSPFVVSVQFTSRARKKAGKKLVRSSLELLTSKDERCMENLLRNLNLASRQSPFSDVHLLGIPLTTLPVYLKHLLEQKTLDKPPVNFLNEIVLKLIKEIGLGKLLTIPELASRSKSKQLPLTKENASRISLLQDLIKPPYNIRPQIKADFSTIRWSHIPARLVILGPILDLVNVLREKKIFKVCENCGKFFLPYRPQEERHVYCCKKCRKRGGEKRRYQERKKQSTP